MEQRCLFLVCYFLFGIGAVVTGILSVFIPGIAGSFMSQGVVWIISTILSFSFFRKKFTKIFKGTILNRNTDKDLGEAAVVIEEITLINQAGFGIREQAGRR